MDILKMARITTSILAISVPAASSGVIIVELVDGSTAYTSYLPERGFPALELTSVGNQPLMS